MFFSGILTARLPSHASETHVIELHAFELYAFEAYAFEAYAFEVYVIAGWLWMLVVAHEAQAILFVIFRR